MQRRSLFGNWEISGLTAWLSRSGPHPEDEESKPMMHGREKSDPSIVAVKLANKTGQPEAESVERREGAKGNTGEQHMRRTQSRESVPQELDRVRKAAQDKKKERFTDSADTVCMTQLPKAAMYFALALVLAFALSHLARSAVPEPVQARGVQPR
jgi:hypothetical protein